MDNMEFSEYIRRIKWVEHDELNLKIVDSVGVLLCIRLEKNSNHFDALIDHIYTNYFKKVSVEKVYYTLLETLVKAIILEHCKNKTQIEIIHIEDVYTGETEMLLVDFDDEIGSCVSDSNITNLQCKEMNIGFKKAFISDKVPINLENMYLMNI
ncbi:hypothetical protein ABD91_20895 [Lysinibacillus sphaericus]|uniref:hypothetical protein n=1 Tax=Lysinibacillus sphaericus TaxID=1421 RepID=UPI0018CDDA7F|nr:hypothetical protein [Lysinibacillus sphaericus]MBG9693201.1 hypothetical protein [Lysinibacillus sphaericus]